VTVTEEELGARTLGDLVRRGRQLGQMEPRELYEIALSLGISPEERDRLEKAGQGEGLFSHDGPARVGEPLRAHLARRIRHGEYRRPRRRRERQEERACCKGCCVRHAALR
jgi:hypothetical protein